LHFLCDLRIRRFLNTPTDKPETLGVSKNPKGLAHDCATVVQRRIRCQDDRNCDDWQLSLLGLFAYLGTSALEENNQRTLQERMVLAQTTARHIDYTWHGHKLSF